MRGARFILVWGLVLVGVSALWAQTGCWARREAVAAVYSSQVGVREQGGNNRGPAVEGYLGCAGFGPGYAWCAAFVSWCFLEAGEAVTPTAWAPAWFPPAQTIYRQGRGERQWLKADLFGLYYQRLGRIGHVGFIDTVQGDTMITVEGNTSGDGGREGDGVYRRRRSVRCVYAVRRVIQ